jgi:cytoskeletal protein CcmA (bactofilin family)
MVMFEKHKGNKPEDSPGPSQPAAQPAPVASAPSSASDRTAIIGRGVTISGDVTAESNLRVEGRIEGRSIESEHDVEVGETARVTASVSGRTVKVSGELNGDIAGSEKVLISKSGRVQGNIVAPRVQLEDGALFRGSIDMTPPSEPAARKPAASATPIDAGTRKEPGLTLQKG